MVHKTVDVGLNFWMSCSALVAKADAWERMAIWYVKHGTSAFDHKIQVGLCGWQRWNIFGHMCGVLPVC